MEVVRRRKVGAAVLLVAVIEEQQTEHELVSLYVFRTSMLKKYPVLQKAVLGFKKIKFDLEADEVSLYNQLTS